MNITEAAKTITATIEEYLDFYEAGDTTDDPRVTAAFGAVNSELPTMLVVDDLDTLFANFADITDADSTLGGYLVRHTEAPRQEAELAACVRDYVASLNHALRTAGYDGDDFTDDMFRELIK